MAGLEYKFSLMFFMSNLNTHNKHNKDLSTSIIINKSLIVKRKRLCFNFMFIFCLIPLKINAQYVGSIVIIVERG